eukprot:Em0003g1117a
MAGPSNEHAGSSNERAGPSNERAGPSNERAGPSNERAGPSNERAGPSNERAGPGNERVGSSDQEHLPVPFQAHQLFLKIVMMTVMPYLIYLRLMKHFPLMESLLSTTRNVCGVKVMSHKKLAKKIVEDKGVMSSPNAKARKSLSEDTVKLVQAFYYHDDISRVMPGKKDFVSARNENGEKEHCQKRLVLCNLREAYKQFKTQHPDVKVGFSKFAELRPKECVLAGATECPGAEALKEELEAAMEENGVETVQYNQWTNTDRANLETRIAPVEEFLDVFMATLKKLQLHDLLQRIKPSFWQRGRRASHLESIL